METLPEDKSAAVQDSPMQTLADVNVSPRKTISISTTYAPTTSHQASVEGERGVYIEALKKPAAISASISMECELTESKEIILDEKEIASDHVLPLESRDTRISTEEVPPEVVPSSENEEFDPFLTSQAEEPPIE